jgi:hypothetical protein
MIPATTRTAPTSRQYSLAGLEPCNLHLLLEIYGE